MEEKEGQEKEKTSEQSYQIHTRKGGVGKVRYPEGDHQGEEMNLEKKTKGHGGEGFTGTASFDVGQGSKAAIEHNLLHLGPVKCRRGRGRGFQTGRWEQSTSPPVGQRRGRKNYETYGAGGRKIL